MKPADIGNLGERYVTAWLNENGYQCYRNTQLPGSTDIEAIRRDKSLLVQVKTAVFPNLPAGLAADEKKAIVARAVRNQKEAWLAKAQVNDDGALLGEIAWVKLN